jgi:alpha-tubulin suppressor-like RCC1 family protein
MVPKHVYANKLNHRMSQLRCAWAIWVACSFFQAALGETFMIDTQVDGGGAHTCAKISGGYAYCWGSNDNGQLGIGSNEMKLSPVLLNSISGVAYISAGLDHTCAVLVDGKIKCWGKGSSGQIGNGLQVQKTLPETVLGIDNAKKVSAGHFHTCAVLTTGQIKCWGNGIMGDGQYTRMQTTPVLVSGISDAQDMCTGEYHSCALVSDGKIKCWGPGNQGALGRAGNIDEAITPVFADGLEGAVQVTCGMRHTCARLGSGSVRCWGSGIEGQLGNGNFAGSYSAVDVLEITNAVQMTSGNDHTCVILATGVVKCWGGNGYGQLGNGNQVAKAVPTGLYSNVAGTRQLSASNLGHTCSVLGTATIRCWGGNWKGQLGDGTQQQSKTGTYASAFPPATPPPTPAPTPVPGDIMSV